MEKFAYCPIFDNGAGLLADTTLDYPMGQDVYMQMQEVCAKTISPDFDEQLDVSEKLYGNRLKFYFNPKDVSDLLDGIKIYSSDEKKPSKGYSSHTDEKVCLFVQIIVNFVLTNLRLRGISIMVRKLQKKQI